MLIQNALLGLFDGFSVLFEHLLNRFEPVAKLLGFDIASVGPSRSSQ
jgi:hypothetical protein